MTAAGADSQSSATPKRVIALRVAWVLAAPLLLLLGAWTTLALYYSNLPWYPLRAALAAVFALGAIAAFVRFPDRWRTAACLVGAFLVVSVWWAWIPASNERDWRPEASVLPRASFDGDLVTVRNIRDFDYRSNDDFTPRYYDKTYDLRELDSVWMLVSYWEGSRAIAHTMLSFGFGDENFLCVSVETRKERAEDYDALMGAFKQFELMYVLADERDVVRVRTNHRGEDVYMYPMELPVEHARALFVDILRSAERIAAEPSFYHTLGRNCTTTLVRHFDAVLPTPVPFHRSLLMNGYSDEFAYAQGAIPSIRPFLETRRAHFISEVAKRYDAARDFSRRIRAHLPRRR